MRTFRTVQGTPGCRIFHALSLILLYLGVMVASPAFLPAESDPSQGSEYDVKAVFLYNFTRYLQWPEDSNIDQFDITVLGESPILASLEEIAGKKTVDTLPIDVHTCRNVRDIGHPRILFISRSASRWFPDVLRETSGTDILVVGEKEGLAKQGAAINFILKGGHIKFEINEDALEEAQIQVSSQLLKLAIRVSPRHPENGS
ncbi:MAG TPA: YfiR family protein [Thermoanaerobaculia bacterium]|nr:YfiR family protein [Thermoanaerobaculia bacterium]HUM30611.1 YfiR family protein [Thermoanaerobaculia bacterium]HXK68861.1 YfiR family protein [Thermoanaerobaculia bacterium]